MKGSIGPYGSWLAALLSIFATSVGAQPRLYVAAPALLESRPLSGAHNIWPETENYVTVLIRHAGWLAKLPRMELQQRFAIAAKLFWATQVEFGSIKDSSYRAERIIALNAPNGDQLARIGGLTSLAHPEVWFAPPDPFARGEHWREFRKDYVSLFAPAAPWSGVSTRTAVYKVSPSLVDSAPDDVLRLIFAELAHRGVALAWEMGPVPPGPGCGAGTEGYAGNTAQSVDRIKAAGGQLQFIAMDEPFWYAHFANTDHSCRYSLEQLARGVAERLGVVRARFPDVQVGDIEPIGNPTDKDYIGRMAQWAESFAAATGRQLAFIHADINWKGNWKDQLRDLRAYTSKASIPLGIIINGDADMTSDKDWGDAALRHEQDVIDIAGVTPEALVFQSWDHFPLRILPEDDHRTMAGIALEGSRPPAQGEVSVTATDVMGRLTDTSGRPLPETIVQVIAKDTQGAKQPLPIKRAGVVPETATTARFALRIGVECTCNGPVDLDIGDLLFLSQGTTVHSRFSADSRPYRLTSQNPLKVAVNAAPFPVVPGQNYHLDIPIRVHEQPVRPGYLALIFFNQQGAEVKRDIIELKAPEEMIATTTTDKTGAFRVNVSAAEHVSQLVIDVQVAATASTRPTILESKPRIE